MSRAVERITRQVKRLREAIETPLILDPAKYPLSGGLPIRRESTAWAVSRTDLDALEKLLQLVDEAYESR